MSHEIRLRWPDDSVPDTEFNLDFVQKMVNRMVQSFHKRGRFRQYKADNDTDLVAAIEERLGLYKKTGNTEWLVDVGNIALMEFSTSSHVASHFRATSSDESPGMPTKDGGRVR